MIRDNEQIIEIARKYIPGIFLSELKNRFLCEVKIDGKVEECYVPSSCHLSNFLQLKGKRVLLVPTQGKNPRTRYALYAAPYRRNYIILNTSLSNVAIEKGINNRRFSYLGKRSDVQKEHSVDGYKADIYIPNTKTIVEIKSVLSNKDEAIFPTVYSERTQNQLKRIQEMLDKGYNVVFIIVSLNPYIKKITIDKSTGFYSELMKCLGKGMDFRAYTSQLCNYEIEIKKQIPLLYL